MKKFRRKLFIILLGMVCILVAYRHQEIIIGITAFWIWAWYNLYM